MRLPALGARRRTPAHTLSRTPLRARAHIRPPLSGASQVSQPSRGARNTLKIKCAFGVTKTVTKCAAVTPTRPLCRDEDGQPRARPAKQYPPPCVGTPAPVSAGMHLGACAYTRARAGKRKARRRPEVYTPAARHVHTGAAGLLPGATGMGFFSARVRRFSHRGWGQCRRRGETPSNRKKTGNAGKRRRTRRGARHSRAQNARPRSRYTRGSYKRARAHPPSGRKKTRNYLALSGFMPIFAVHKSAAARGGSPPLDSRNSPPLAFIPPNRRRAERGAVLKRTICSSFAIIVFCSVIRLDVRQLQLCYGLLLFPIFRF